MKEIDLDHLGIEFVNWEKVVTEAIHGESVQVKQGGEVVLKITPVEKTVTVVEKPSAFWQVVELSFVFLGIGIIVFVVWLFFGGGQLSKIFGGQ